MCSLKNIFSKKKLSLTIILICFCCVSSFSQEQKIKNLSIDSKSLEARPESDAAEITSIKKANAIPEQTEKKAKSLRDLRSLKDNIPNELKFNIGADQNNDEVRKYRVKEFPVNFVEEENEPLKIPKTRVTPTRNEFRKFQRAEKFYWKSAMVQSLYFLGIQQGFRMVQKKTRRELDGRFFADWGRSVKNLGGWRDGDSFATNYIAHPMQGAVTGRIFINNSDRSKKLEFGKSDEYWKSRAKAMIWSTVWSTQFELGPISEASIGNVGLYDQTGPNLMGWVDLVVTPIAGTGVIIGEDLVDKYILKKWLERGSSRTRIKILRTFITPFQSFTNVLRWKAPWKRDNR